MSPDPGDDKPQPPEGEQPDAEPLDDDELVYRRIPVGDWYNAERDEVSPLAFNPMKRDTTGLSVSRAKYTTPAECVRNDRGKHYHIAVLRVGDLREAGIEVEPSPVDGARGHAEIPSQRHGVRKEQASMEARVRMATELVLEVLNPPHDDDE